VHPLGPVIVGGHDTELAQSVLHGVATRESSRQRVVQIVWRSAGNDGFVESNEAGLTALLKEPRENFRGHLTPGSADPAGIPSWTPMHVQAACDVDAHNGNRPSTSVG